MSDFTHYHKTWFQDRLIKKGWGEPLKTRWLFRVLLNISFWFDDWRFGRPCCASNN